MAVKWFNRFQALTLDATHDHYEGAADNTATINGSGSLSATAARVGTLGGLFGASTADQLRFDTSTDMIDPLLGVIGVWLRTPTASANAQSFLSVLGVSGNITFQLQGATLHVITNNEIAGESELMVATALAANEFYFIVYRWDHANNLRGLYLYDNSLALVDSTVNSDPFTAPADLATASGLRIGNTSGGDRALHIDNLFIADAYAEPLEANATITSYTEYSGAASGVTIDSIDDVTLTHGQTGVTITGSGFGASQGTGQVIVSPTDDINDGDAVAQTVTSWGDTSIDFTADLDSFAFSTTLYVFVINDDGESNADGEAVSRIIASATLDFTGVNFFFDEVGDPVEATGTLYVWRAPRPPASVGTPDQIITDFATSSAGERSQAIDLGSLEDGDTVFGMLFGADGTDIYWAGEKLPIYA